MKKRIFSLVLAVILIIPCAFIFTACGDKTTTLEKGNYEITKYTIDGVEQPELVGDIWTIDGENMINQDGKKGVATLKDDEVTITIEGEPAVVFVGVRTGNIIDIVDDREGVIYIIQLTYRPEV